MVMKNVTNIGCACGQTRLELRGEPILVSECLCTSCRLAADRLATLPSARNILTTYSATPCAEYRKDRVRILSGAEYLSEFRLSADAGTRRFVATCCNTPIFMELKGAHWLSVYLHLWPEQEKPKVALRTMTGDLPDRSSLPSDIPNLKTHSVMFYAKLLMAWASMGFKNPKINSSGKIDV